MKCEICHKNDAKTVLHKKDENGEDQELYVCKDCAAASNKGIKANGIIKLSGGDIEVKALTLGPDGKPVDFEPPPFLKEIVERMADQVVNMAFDQSREASKCPQCGRPWNEIKNSAKLGCPNCYSHFKHIIEGEFLRGQYGIKHMGGMPPNVKGEATRDFLMRELRKAVKNEDFERAKKLRAEIDALNTNGETESR